jgi:hypothetical protein
MAGQGKVVHGDAAALMDLPHRRTGVRLRPTERTSEELDLACP